eukprot:1159307-Pelagomonas_calceolata.AAC.3
MARLSFGIILCGVGCMKPAHHCMLLFSGDARTSTDLRAFLLAFMERFPHLKENELYFAGESCKLNASVMSCKLRSHNDVMCGAVGMAFQPTCD